MQHAIGSCHWSKHKPAGSSTSSRVAEKRFCAAMRRVNFQTHSMVGNCGLYACRNGKRKSDLYFLSNGASKMVRRYLALSATNAMRFARVRCRNSFFRNVSNAIALKLSQMSPPIASQRWSSGLLKLSPDWGGYQYFSGDSVK